MSPCGFILRIALAVMLLKKTFPSASTAGPSRKHTIAPRVTFASGGTSWLGNGVFEKSGGPSASKLVGKLLKKITPSAAGTRAFMGTSQFRRRRLHAIIGRGELEAQLDER